MLATASCATDSRIATPQLLRELLGVTCGHDTTRAILGPNAMHPAAVA